MSGAPGSASRRAPAIARRGRRRRVSVLGVIGEVLVTAGILVLLFVVWSVWFNSWVLNGQQTSAAASLGRDWLEGPGAAPARPSIIPAEAQPAAAQPIAVMYVPRWGGNWERVIGESVDIPAVLDSPHFGVGHYSGTAMPGAVGNFAVAGHDTGWGNAFLGLKQLHVGDRIYLQTKQGFYTYVFRDYVYVQPTAVDVLLPVPQVPGAIGDDRIMTMTTCNPMYHGVERLVAFAVFDSFSTTAPAAIAGQVG